MILSLQNQKLVWLESCTDRTRSIIKIKLRNASDYMFQSKTSDLAIIDERCVSRVALYKERAKEYNLLFQIREGSNEHY